MSRFGGDLELYRVVLSGAAVFFGGAVEGQVRNALRLRSLSLPPLSAKY